MRAAAPTADVDDPAAGLRLADQAMAEGNYQGAVAHLSAAVHRLTAAGDNRRAAQACISLGTVISTFLGNRVAAHPWFTRAMRLVENQAPCLEQGYAALANLGCEVDDPAVLLQRAELALTGPGGSATSTSRSRLWPTAGWPRCRRAGCPRAWP